MDKKVIKLGVVGLKRGGYVAGTVIGDENVVIRAIADKDEKARLECIKNYEEKGARDFLVFDNYEDLLKTDIDVVFIGTDKPYHAKHAIMALEAGKHVISEIPAIETLEEAKDNWKNLCNMKNLNKLESTTKVALWLERYFETKKKN